MYEREREKERESAALVDLLLRLWFCCALRAMTGRRMGHQTDEETEKEEEKDEREAPYHLTKTSSSSTSFHFKDNITEGQKQRQRQKKFQRTKERHYSISSNPSQRHMYTAEIMFLPRS